MLLRHLSAISPPSLPALTSSQSDEDGSPARPYKSLQWGIAAMQPFADGIRLSLERKAFSKKIYEFQFFQDHKTTQLQVIIQAEMDGTNLMTCPVIW